MNKALLFNRPQCILLLALTIALTSFFDLSATTKTDSLKLVLENANVSTELLTLDNLTNELLNVDHEEALIFAKRGLDLALKNKDTLALTFYDYLGEIHRKLGNYQDAIDYLTTGLALKKNNDNAKGIAISYNKLGKVYVNKGDYDLAIANFMTALEIMEKTGNKEGQAFYLNNIGIVYDFQSMYEQALKFYEASLSIKNELNNEAGIASTTNNIAIVYFNLKEYEKSLSYHKKALDLNLKLNRQNSLSKSYNNVGFALMFLDRNEEAVDYLQKSLELREQLSDNPGIANSLNNLSRAYFNLKYYQKALNYAQKGLTKAQEVVSNELTKDSYLLLSEIAEKTGNEKAALANYKQYILFKDSLITISNSEILAEAEAKYQNQKKEIELKNKEIIIEQKNLELVKETNQRRLIGLLFIGALITLSLSMFGYFQKRRISILLKAQNILIENKNKVLTADNSTINRALKDKSAILSKVYAEKKETELPPELLSLSQREMEVLSFLALGWTDQAIADKMFISKSTVKTHLRRIYSKLLVKSRTEAVSIAHQHNIIGGKEPLLNETYS